MQYIPRKHNVLGSIPNLPQKSSLEFSLSKSPATVWWYVLGFTFSCNNTYFFHATLIQALLGKFLVDLIDNAGFQKTVFDKADEPHIHAHLSTILLTALAASHKASRKTRFGDWACHIALQVSVLLYPTTVKHSNLMYMFSLVCTYTHTCICDSVSMYDFQASLRRTQCTCLLIDFILFLWSITLFLQVALRSFLLYHLVLFIY